MSGRILFSGYYGLGNAGDEAVLAASVELFRKRRPDLEISALSASPSATAAALGIHTAPRMEPRAVLAELRRCSLFLSGGGSLLQDRTSLQSLLYYLTLLVLARQAVPRRGRRTMIFAQGIGPLIRPAARRVTARVLRTVDAITVRDPASAALLREIGVTGKGAPEIEVTADPVFALEPRPTERVAAQSPARPAVAVSLRPWPGVERIVPRLADALRPLTDQVSLQAWPLFPGDDTAVCEALAAALPAVRVMREPLEPGEWMALAGSVDAVLAMRLHALIFAAARATPVLGVSYDPKVDALLARLGARPVATAETLEPEAVRAALEAALADSAAEAGARRARAEELRAVAARNVDRALALL